MKRWAMPLSALLAAFAVCGFGTLLIGRTAFRAASGMQEQATREAQRMVVEVSSRWSTRSLDALASRRYREQSVTKAGRTEWARLAELGPLTTEGEGRMESMRLTTDSGAPQTRAVISVPVRSKAGPSTLVVTLLQEDGKWRLDGLERKVP